METGPATAQAEAAVDASVAAFMAALAGRGPAGSIAVSGGAGGRDAAVGIDDDPLQRVVDAALDVLAGVARSEAKFAAVKVLAVGVLAGATKA